MNINYDSIYAHIGGEKTIRKIVEAFYPKVQAHPELSKIFPEDINPVKEKQFLFLSQFFGGPPLYSNAYGHPMMRARHSPFPITPERARDWLSCMSQALEEIGLSIDQQAFILERLKGPAFHFVNTPESE